MLQHVLNTLTTVTLSCTFVFMFFTLFFVSLVYFYIYLDVSRLCAFTCPIVCLMPRAAEQNFIVSCIMAIKILDS